MSATEFLWTQKYRPKTIVDCILPDDIKATFSGIVQSKNMQNLLLCGGAGCGKTTVALALCEEMGLDYIFINGSENGNIDTLRTTIRNFASTVSLQGGHKVVIIDEADFLNQTSTMPALRSFIEEFSKNCRFILTCNYSNRIIDPIKSRMSIIDFKITGKEKPKLAEKFFKRISEILKKENVDFDKKVVVELIVKHFPDFRRVLGELQRYSANGKIDAGVLVNFAENNFKLLLKHMKDKNFTDVRKWVAQNVDIDSTSLFRTLYDSLADTVSAKSIPSIVLVLAEYQYKMAFSADQEICLAACLAEIMLNAEFKE